MNASVLPPSEQAPESQSRAFATQVPTRDSQKHPNDKNSLVVVRYFLDRPGYNLHNSAVARFWWNPPTPMCQAADIREFLVQHGILWGDRDATPGQCHDNIMAEIYLDRFQAYMMLDMCEQQNVQWDFSSPTHHTLNVRLTDLAYAHHATTAAPKTVARPPHANSTPVGLFGFCYVTFMDTAQLMGKILQDEGYYQPATIGSYMFFVGGVPLFVAGCFQVVRNNLYGGTAFITFGCFWMANGVRTMVELVSHDPASDVDDPMSDDNAGDLVRLGVLLAFSLVLLKATLVMNRLSTTLITLLCCKIAAAALAGWHVSLEWTAMILGWIVGVMAFYVFMVEFLNQVYPTKLFPTFPWDLHSPKEVFGAAGDSGTLMSKAARLRQAESFALEKKAS